jgi:hypothetical protein
MYQKMSGQISDLGYDGTVRCQTCGETRKVNVVNCLRSGWPTCCGETMELVKTKGGKP